jgi:hypothetical protein
MEAQGDFALECAMDELAYASGRHQDVIASFELRWWHLGFDTIVTSEWGHAPRSLIVIAASRGGGRWQCEKVVAL